MQRYTDQPATLDVSDALPDSSALEPKGSVLLLEDDPIVAGLVPMTHVGRQRVDERECDP